MENSTAAATTPKTKSNTWLYVLGALGVLGIILLSSFTSAGSSSADTLTPCQSDPNCLKGYWKWVIIRGWYQDIITKAAANGKSVAAQLDDDAQWEINEKTTPGTDLTQWNSLVTAETARVKATTPNLAPNDARYVAIQNILTSLQ